ncbi:MAG: sulfatase-like hydrolase/transferase [Hyphomicrobiales bacterium]|nr:sulfatase-like hydrolase/transferase [Hyphomicrobiales bacterium]
MPQPRSANTIVFVTDNQAQSAVGCYGAEAIRTPAIDSIARRGVRFDNAYCASPLCCPSRAALATGRFPHQTGFFDNVIVYDGSVPSWMHRVRAAGRKVVSVGKLHFRAGDDDNGFSEERIPMHILNRRGGTAMLLRAAGGERPATGQWELYTEQSGVGATPYQQYDRDITRSAIEWLRQEAKAPSSQPWILFVSYASPHPPFLVPPYVDDDIRLDDVPLPVAFRLGERTEHPAAAHLRAIMGTRPMEDAETLRRVAKAYYGLISHIDRQVGEVLGEIEGLDLGDLRLVFTSDHGEMLGTHGLFGKSNVYEGAIKVPLIMSGPGLPEGTVRTPPVSHVDLFPTLLDAVGVAIEDADADLPGQSLFGPVDEDRPLFTEYHATGTTGGAYTVRVGDFKLIYHVDYPPELFDLANDPYETINLAETNEHAAVREDLTARLRAICDPEAVDRAAKQAQVAKVEEFGGRAALISEGALVYTPPPGKPAEVREIT